ncbi:MAG: hypothetical protein LUD01_02700, partial [Clostridiales bacterium]|nr:hypothetical protein [Clostridiales bacterium]
MSFCRRFVTYLFQYDNQTKGRNCGFAKVDARQGRCRMEIQIKGCEDGKYAVYLLRQSEQELVGLPIGEIRIGNGAGKSVLTFPTEKIGGSRFGLEDMQGMYLSAGKNSFAASQWEDGELAWGTFRIYDGRDMLEVPAEEAKGKAADAESDGIEGVLTGTSDNKEEKEKLTEAEPVAQPEMQATQTAAAIDISPYMTAWEKRWQRFCALHPLLFLLDEEKNIYAVKMDLRDVRS